MTTMRWWVGSGAFALAAAAAAAEGPDPSAPAAAVGAPADAGSARGAARRAEAVARVTVIEDDGVRIEETRLRGAAQRITVQSKVGNVREYEILVGRGGRDPSQDRGAAGQRAWSVLGF